MKFLNIFNNIMNETVMFFSGRSFCIFCVFWFIPFLAGMTIFGLMFLLILFLLGIFIPIFMPIFVILMLGFAMINTVLHMPLLSILFLFILWYMKDDILHIWQNLFIKKNYTLQKSTVFSTSHYSISLILSLFVMHGLIYVLPIPKIIKFLFLSLASVYVVKKQTSCNH